MSELIIDTPGYHIVECIEKQCAVCKFCINGHCKYGLDEK